MQHVLAAHPQALFGECLLVDLCIHGLRRKAIGHDEVGLDERRQDAMRDQHRQLQQNLAAVLGGGRTLAELGIDDAGFGFLLFSEGRLVAEEKLELEQVAQRKGGRPRTFQGAGQIVVRVIQQGQLQNCAVHEPVDGAVAVKRRNRMLAVFDLVHRGRPALVAADHAGAHQRVQDVLHAFGLAQGLKPAARQLAGLGVVQQRLDLIVYLAQGQGTLVYPQQRKGDQRRRRDRRAFVDALKHLEGDLCHRPLAAALVVGPLQCLAQ